MIKKAKSKQQFNVWTYGWVPFERFLMLPNFMYELDKAILIH